MLKKKKKQVRKRNLNKNQLLCKSCFSLFILLAFIYPKAGAQDTLRLEEAVQMAMENNLSLRLQRYDVELAENNRSYAYAGFLPTLGALVDRNQSVTYNEQQFYDGRERINAGAQASSLTASAGLNWTIFDGFNMFYARNALVQDLQMSEVEYQMMAEEVLSGVIILYYNIVAEQMALEVLADAMELSRERLQLAERGLEIGRNSQMDVLQARTDYISDSVSVVRQYTAIRQLKSDLNTSLGRAPSENFIVRDSIEIREPMVYNQLEENTASNNTRIRLARENLNMARINTRLAKSQFYPVISAYAGYTYVDSESQAGLLQKQIRRGPEIGLTGSLNIFNGMTARRNYQNANIMAEAGQVNVQQTELEVANEFNKAWLEYQANMSLLSVEEANLEAARENLEIAYGMYQLGAMNNIEFRETQRKLIDAENRYLQTRFLVKANEVRLIRMSGFLIGNNR